MTELVSAHMPLVERLRKGANCVIFLDGAPEPAADVADMLRKAADKIEELQERCAKIVEGEVYKEHYRTWPQLGCGNRTKESEIVKHCDALAAVIRRVVGDQT